MDCEIKWERAINWIKAHSYWEIRTIRDDLMATREGLGRQNSKTSYRVMKKILKDGSVVINMNASCSGISCNPEPERVTKEFYAYIETGKEESNNEEGNNNGL